MASVLPSYTNFVSFSSYPYKFGLIKTLIHYTYERSNSWSLFIEESSNFKNFLMKSMYPSNLIDKQLKRFLCNKFFTQNPNKNSPFSNSLRRKPHTYVKRFVAIVFISVEIDDSLLGKDYLSSSPKSPAMYKLVFIGCKSC